MKCKVRSPGKHQEQEFTDPEELSGEQEQTASTTSKKED